MEELERTQAEARLQALEAAVLADVEQFGACSLAEKLKVQRLGQAVQEKLSQIRALTRDLELLFEELDRWEALEAPQPAAERAPPAAAGAAALPPHARTPLPPRGRCAAMRSGSTWRGS